MYEYFFTAYSKIDVESEIDTATPINTDFDFAVFIGFLYGTTAFYKVGGYSDLNNRISNIEYEINKKQDDVKDELRLGNALIKTHTSGNLDIVIDSTLVARFNSDNNLLLAGGVHQEVDAIDIDSQVDSTSSIVDTEMIGLEEDVGSFISFIFGLPITSKPVDNLSINKNGDLLVNSIQTGDAINFSKNGTLNINEILENQKF